MSCRRGDRVVVRSPRGLELGTVLCPSSDRQRRLLMHTPVGEILRLGSGEDERVAGQRQELSQEIIGAARGLADAATLPLEILDAEVLLDGQLAILLYL